MGGASFHDAQATSLLRRVVGGESRAFVELVRVLWPEVQSLLERSRRLAASRNLEDARNEIAVTLMEKLERDDFRALRQYEDWQLRHPDKAFGDWLRIVLANATRDFLRAERSSGGPVTEGMSPVRVLNEFAASEAIEHQGYRPPITAAQTARQLLEFAERELDVEKFAALASWLQGADFEELAQLSGLSNADAARKLVRAAVASLRRRFAERTNGAVS